MVILYIAEKLSTHYDLRADLAVLANYEVPKSKTYCDKTKNNNWKPKLTTTITLSPATISKIRIMY